VDQREFKDIIPIDQNGNLTLNQYTKPKSDAEWFNLGYRYLVSRCIEEPDETGTFSCWIPSGPGISIVESDTYKYRRMKLQNTTPLCHVFAWAYHHPGIKKEYDISHLCGNPKCCRPSHLHHEERKYQRTRDGCTGFVIQLDCGETDVDDAGTITSDEYTRYYRVCKHNPHCKKAVIISTDNEIVNKPSE
jgi:hypothetical protein